MISGDSLKTNICVRFFIPSEKPKDKKKDKKEVKIIKQTMLTEELLEPNQKVPKIEEGVVLMTKAIYAASFDPFTNGHLDILTKASRMFGEVHAVIAINSEKNRRYNAVYMKDAIEKIVENNGLSNVKVAIWDDLVAKYCIKNNIGYTVRGLRNFMDFSYEENIANVNKLVMPELETVYLRAEYVGISSSMVKELYQYGQDVSKFVPVEILPILRTY